MSALEYIIPTFIVLILSLSFHEAAHAWAADRLGDPTARMMGRLTLNPLAHIDWIGTVLFPLLAMYSGLPLIGWAKPVPVVTRNLREPRLGFAAIAAAGPASNLVIALGGAMIFMAVGNAVSDSSALPFRVIEDVVRLNVLLAVFNLVPVPPLDGGNVLMGLVPDTFARMVDFLRPYGILILYLLMFSGMLWRIVGPIYGAILGFLLP